MIKVYLSRINETGRDAQKKAGRDLLIRALAAEYPQIREHPVIVENEYGKPYLKDFPDIFFNISHSADAVACAVADCDVGVDVQAHRKLSKHIERKFHSEERRFLERLPYECREKAFFDIWTRKESFMKADGRGLRIPLDGFCSVSGEERDAGRLFGGIPVRVGREVCGRDFFVMQCDAAGEGLSLAVCASENEFDTFDLDFYSAVW